MMQNKEEVIRILDLSRTAVNNGSSSELKSLSEQVINDASLHQDPDEILVAVVVYSLSKILEKKGRFSEFPGWSNFLRKLNNYLKKAKDSLEKDDLEGFRKNLSFENSDISAISGKLKENIGEVFRKARINKASKLYENGISLQKTAKLLGVSSWDLAEVIGKSDVQNIKYNQTIDVKSRLNNALRIFGP